MIKADAGLIAAEVAAGREFTLEIQGESVVFEPEDCQVQTSSAGGYACAGADGFMVALDTTLNDALVLEGVAREIVRTVQDARKSADLEISDRVALGISGSALAEQAKTEYRDYIMAETLAETLSAAADVDGFDAEKTLEDESWQISLVKV